jgi:hypothetical protein
LGCSLPHEDSRGPPHSCDSPNPLPLNSYLSGVARLYHRFGLFEISESFTPFVVLCCGNE